MSSKKIISGILGVLAMTSIVACDTDFNEIGSEIIGNDQFQFDKYTVQNVTASTHLTEAVNTRNLTNNSLGHYDDQLFGGHTAHIVTLVEMASNNVFTDVGANPIIDSVYVYIPYDLKDSSPLSDGSTSYTLNNVYGSGTFDLKVYQNGYFLTTADPSNNFGSQFYYADQKELFDTNIASPVLNNSAKSAQNTAFKFNKDEIILYKYNADGTPQLDESNQPIIKERKKPGLWLDLDKNYFQNKFFANNAHKNLLNNSIFKEFFRGLYFQTNNPAGNALAQLDLSKGELVIVYKEDKSDTSNERVRKTISFKMGNTEASATSVNLFENNYSDEYLSAIANANNPLIWLKGNNASYSKIKLFGDDTNQNGKPDELDEIISNQWLINQAVLTVSIDENTFGTNLSTTPSRLYLYDIKNNKVLIDYTADQTTTPLKSTYGGILNTTTNQYQFRITDYISNLVKKDSTNFELGLVVASDISNTIFNVVKNETTKIPLTSTMFPFGTVIYGPEHTSPKKMKLDIYYTNPN